MLGSRLTGHRSVRRMSVRSSHWITATPNWVVMLGSRLPGHSLVRRISVRSSYWTTATPNWAVIWNYLPILSYSYPCEYTLSLPTGDTPAPCRSSLVNTCHPSDEKNVRCLNIFYYTACFQKVWWKSYEYDTSYDCHMHLTKSDESHMIFFASDKVWWIVIWFFFHLT